MKLAALPKSQLCFESAGIILADQNQVAEWKNVFTALDIQNRGETIDEVTVQGVMHRNAAAKQKNRDFAQIDAARSHTHTHSFACLKLLQGLFRGIYRACVKQGLLARRSTEDPFMPAYKLIGFLAAC